MNSSNVAWNFKKVFYKVEREGEREGGGTVYAKLSKII